MFIYKWDSALFGDLQVTFSHENYCKHTYFPANYKIY